MYEKVRLSTQQVTVIFLFVGVLTCAIRLAWLASSIDVPVAAGQSTPLQQATDKPLNSAVEEMHSDEPIDAQASHDIELPHDNEFDSARLNELTLSSVDRRLEAIDALGQSGNAKAVTILRELLDDPDASVREEAVEALARIGDAPSVAGLGYALSDEIEMVRLLAVDNLAEIGSDEALANLALVTTDNDREIRIAAIEGLAESSSVSSTSLLQLFLADDDEMVRQLATEFMDDNSENQDESLP